MPKSKRVARLMEEPRYVVIGTPVLDGRVSVEYLRSLQGTIQLLAAQGIPSEVIMQMGDCFVAKARNAIVKQFLAGQGTDLFFIDEDQGWDPDTFVTLLLRPEPVMAAVPPRKQDETSYPVIMQSPLTQGPDGHFLARMVGAAFMRLKREVLDALQALEPGHAYRNPEPGADPDDIYHAFFEAGVVNGEFWGEDYWFCDKLHRAGFEIWIHANASFSHVGRKRWEGNLWQYIARLMQNAPTSSEIAASALPGNGTDEDRAYPDRSEDGIAGVRNVPGGRGEGYSLGTD